MQCAKTSGLQCSSTMESGLARFSSTPVHTIAPRAKGLGDQIVANGVGQTAVDGAPASCGSLSLWRARRRDVVTARDTQPQLAECSMLSNGNAGHAPERPSAAMRTLLSLCLGRRIRLRIPAPANLPRRRRCAFGMDTHGARSRGPGRCRIPGQALMHRRSTVPGEAWRWPSGMPEAHCQRRQIRRPQRRLAPRIGTTRTPWGFLAGLLRLSTAQWRLEQCNVREKCRLWLLACCLGHVTRAIDRLCMY